MGIEVVARSRIARPPDEVATFAMDPSNDPRWIGGVRESELLGDPPLARGSRVRRVASFMGRRVDYVMEIVAHEPPVRMSMVAISAPFPMEVDYRFDADGDGATRAQIEVRGDPSGFFALAAPLMARRVRTAVEGDLERLRALLGG